MTVNLTPDQERLLTDVVRSGAYATAEQALQHALEWLSQEQWLYENRNAISAMIDEGWAQAERGELIDGDEVRSDMAARKSAWLAEKRSA